jgi:hypothetical protein
MRRHVCSLYLFFLLSGLYSGGLLHAASELSELDCGFFRGYYYYYLNIFSGWGGGFDQSGQFRENPVLLGCLEGNQFSLGMNPRFCLDAGTLMSDYNNRLNTEIDDLISSVKSDTLRVLYPRVNLAFGQSGGIKDLTIRMHSGVSGSWGISLWSPLLLGGELTGNSITMTLATDAGLSDNEETRIVLGNDLRLAAELQLNQTRMSYVYRFKNDIHLGVGIDLIHVKISGDGYSRTEGFIRQYGGDTDITQAFNDPLDGEYFRNTLDNYWHLGYEDLITGINGGLSYQLTESSLLDLGFSQPCRQELSGSSEGVLHEIGAVDYEALIGLAEGELFDELLLEPSRMTYTNATVYSSRSLVFSYPGILRFGLGIELARTRHQFSLAAYLGDLSFRYKGYVRENGREKTGNSFKEFERSRGVDYTWGMEIKSKLEYNLVHRFSSRFGMYFTFQYYTMKELDDNAAQEDATEDLLHLAAGNFGLSWQLSEKLKAECMLAGFPGPFLSTKLTYRFGRDE